MVSDERMELLEAVLTGEETMFALGRPWSQACAHEFWVTVRGHGPQCRPPRDAIPRLGD